jgi:hypothetical protein
MLPEQVFEYKHFPKIFPGNPDQRPDTASAYRNVRHSDRNR